MSHRLALGMGVLGMALASCLSTNDGGSGGGGSSIRGGAVCAKMTSILQSCGVLSSGIIQCTEPEGDAEICQANCALAASCEEWKSVFCGDATMATSLMTCSQGCSSSNSGGDYVCGSGETIPASWECDGATDCSDASDEANCASSPSFQCADGQSVPAYAECDGFDDCVDGSDEAGCPTFACSDGTMVPANRQCDKNQDCSDGSDESGCALPICN